jgi:hypothetical protein
LLKWLGKALGGAPGQGSVSVESSWVAHLKGILDPIELPGPNQGRSGLAKDMLGYVLAGDSPRVLQEVAQGEQVGKHLKLIGHLSVQDSEPQSRFYKDFPLLPVETGLRWASLLEASLTRHVRQFKMQFPNGRHWPEALLLHSAGCGINVYSMDRAPASAVSASCFEALLSADGADPAALLIAAFTMPVKPVYGAERRLQMVSVLPGYADALERHIEAVRPLVPAADVDWRLHTLAMLKTANDATLRMLARELTDLATGGSKQVRHAAQPLVRRCGEAADEPLRSLAVEAKPEQRGHALRLLVWLAKERRAPELAEFARAAALADKAPSVQALIGEWDRLEAPQPEALSSPAYDIPRIDWTGRANLPSAATLDELWRDINAAVQKANQHAREHHERLRAQGRVFPLHQAKPYTATDAQRLRDYLLSDERQASAMLETRNSGWGNFHAAIRSFAAKAGVTPVALAKVLNFFGMLLTPSNGSLTGATVAAFNLLLPQSQRPTLLELAQILGEMGVDAKAVLNSYCLSWGMSLGNRWPSDTVWPYFAQHLDLVEEALNHPIVGAYGFDRSKLYRAIGLLPSLPHGLANSLFNLALGPGKTEREPAQEALARHPGKEERIVAALGDGKAETRAVAAQWLVKLRRSQAIPDLERAVAKEKNDLAKGAMLDALQIFGQPVEKYLSREALASEAARSTAKGTPKELEWFPWDAMPAVRWGDSREQVGADIQRWMIVQAVKQKQPEPNAVLRKYCAMFESGDRDRFGQWLLELWLREDVRPIPADEAMQRASAQGQSTHQLMTQHPKYFANSPQLGKSAAELTAMYLPALLRQPAGSAIASKGILAVAAACAGAQAAAPTQRYLKEWYGTRAGQGKALIAMLAWIEHPSATQLMLAIGSRFRTKSFQDEATRQAEALAERRGWTLSELADRTTPSAGFDEDGIAELSFGSRCFTARLTAELKVELFNPEGKKIASLPEPRVDDDAELAKASKRAFSACKKEIKSVVDLQTDRLYEALCTGRDWSFDDWDTYLNRHPVVRHLVQRLVWSEVRDGVSIRSFRPLGDRTLTDLDDNEIKLDPAARISLAHDSILAAEAVARWQQHLLDYDIAPLFQQLGKGAYVLPKAQETADGIKEFEGHLVETFALRGRALKLGYLRGAPGDGGWFTSYEKRFASLGIVAVIEFTGNSLPETSRTAALLSLYFTTAGDAQSWNPLKIELGQIPKVLLSECYGDLRLLASEGKGHDGDWKTKVQY